MEQKIKIRVRLIIIHNDKILLSYVKSENFYFFIGGKMEFGETVEAACMREIKEECNGAQFTMKKIVYLRDYIPHHDEHNLELYIWGEIDQNESLDGLEDPEFPGDHFQYWIPLDTLTKKKVLPEGIARRLKEDYEKGFEEGCVYVGDGR